MTNYDLILILRMAEMKVDADQDSKDKNELHLGSTQTNSFSDVEGLQKIP